MELVLFDLDNTLLAGDSDFEWAQFLIAKGVLDRELYEARNATFYDQYRAGTLDIHEFLNFQLAPLARHSRSELDTWHAEFMTKQIRPRLSDGARALVNGHLETGALCAIVTATNSFITGPIARELDIPHLVATIPAQQDGEFTGKPRGTPAFRDAGPCHLHDGIQALQRSTAQRAGSHHLGPRQVNPTSLRHRCCGEPAARGRFMPET